MSGNFDKQMEKAGKRHAAGDLKGASKIYRSLLSRDPGNDIVKFYKALADFDLGQRDKAIESLRDITTRVRDVPKIQMDLGYMLEREGRYEEASQAFEAASRLAPMDPNPYVMVAHMKIQTGDPEAAVLGYRKALDLHPGADAVRVGLTRALMTVGDWDEALIEVDRVLRAKPGHTGAMALKSVICYETDNPDDARRIADFENRLMLHDIADHCGADQVENYNAALSEAITNHPTIAYEPKDYSTKKGFHTGDITFDKKGPVPEFLDWIRSEVDKLIAECRARGADDFERAAPNSYKLNAWGVVMEDQGHQASHIHRDAWLSGVYYPKVPEAVREDDPHHAGWIEFGTPHEYPNRKTVSDTRLLKPEPGRAIFFPSYFYHRTVPLKSDETRISIAFDVLPQ
ncbi:MAG: tetratricopeptide repeat protein [Rhodospirillales bacterium]|nr:tetratricopeptide repeat protein [Rhodospirillales bacterium]